MNDDEHERDVLEARACLLARPRVQARSSAQLDKHAVFERSGTRYAIAPQFVFAVSHALMPTPLPGTAPFWAGISSVQGELLALVDLPVLLESSDASAPIAGDEAQQADAEDHRVLVLVLGREQRELGLLIDAVLDASSLSLELLRVPSADVASQLLLGTTSDGTRVVRGDALLSDPRLFIQANHFPES